jgi:hypothetical protein
VTDQRAAKFGAAGLVFSAFGAVFVAADWAMSLEPEWHSTMFSVILVVSQVLAAFAAMIVILVLSPLSEPSKSSLTHAQLRDLGNLLLTFTVFWAYVAFSEFLLIWSGNLPAEISWYVHRSHGGWEIMAVILALSQFFFPFALLLSRKRKEHPKRLGAVAGLVLAGSVLNDFWLVAPSLHTEGFYIHWLDFTTLLAMGGIWAGAFVFLLSRRNIAPLSAGEAADHA